ncbi:ESX secretion-associated protein EspG [Kutzneria sp. CA-103260]|uniref:ESX secretion-associated protein EspG n=1 Tax=Kutzneria sp. CA-103260 TaxID=2802641 RepID=UPI001BA9B526|nr:ESX secretion-associated protein EspG [Kutzneria sp. CA-103260]QUQ68258.1 EspG family protein [Kutzneria sp. CA-103260]
MAVVELNYAELGVAWQRSRLPVLPVIFTWRNHAAVPDDPQRALHEAEDRLRARGIIDRRGGLDDDLYGALALFTHAPVEIDLRFAPAVGREVRASVAARGGHAVRAVVDDDAVWLETVPADQLPAALIQVLPELPPACGTVVSLPTAELDAAVCDVTDRGNDSDAAFTAALQARGVRSDDARNLVSLLGGDRTGFGKIGVAARDAAGHRHRSPRVVQVIDTLRGRSALYTRGGYTVSSPADFGLLTRIVDELVAGTRRRL